MGIYGVDFYGTTFYGAPLYLEFDARPFNATPVGYGSIRLDWVNPEGDWDRMRVLRSSYGYPDYHEDGVLILEKGSEAVTSVVDHTVKPGKFFYYTVWVRETENQVWVRAADVIALPTADHQYGNELYSFMPAWLQEADDDRTSPSQPDGPLRRYLDVFGRMLDHVRTEYDTLMWTRDPEKISGNLLRLFAQQYGIPHEPALGMRQTRVWLRDAVYLYRTKGTRPGVEAAASAITGWGARVTFSKNLLRGGGKFGWYPGAVGPDIEDAFAPDDPSIAVLRVSWSTSSWSISTAPSEFDETLPHWFRLHVMPGMDYTASCSIRPAAGVAGGIPHRWRIRWFDHDGEFLSVEDGDFVNSEENKWVAVRSTFNAPLMADCGVLSFQSGSGSPVASDVYIRHAQFEQSPLATPWVEPRAVVVNFDPVRWNYIPNPSFENGMFAWFIREGSASLSDQAISGLGGQSVLLDGTLESEKMGVATFGVPHVFSIYVEGEAEVTLSLNWFTAPEDEDPIFGHTRTYQVSGVQRVEVPCPMPATAAFGSVKIETDSEVRIDNALFEEGSTAGDYFDGSRFGADWLWAGVPHASASKYFPSRTIRNVRVRELLPHYLPLNQVFLLNYVGGAPPSGRAITGDEGNVGVGTYGIMPFGQ